jgi:mannose-1-phosphate guanylyltransferase / mannose-6-phosphate isomerase
MGKADSARRITPVILSGGAGTRLWPLSRAQYPKQFLPLGGRQTMIQEAASRVSGERFERPIIICNEDHRFIVVEQMEAIGIQPQKIILEPIGRSTAPAACVAALLAREADPEALLLVMPSDHIIADQESFRRAVDAAAAAAAGGMLMTFGIKPAKPETGYGYIKSGTPVAGYEGVCAVSRFVEKPDRKTAETYVADGGYSWNSGIFLFSAAAYLDELERNNPAIIEACRTALAGISQDRSFHRLDKAAFMASPSDSIDYAVMEKTAKAAVVSVDMGWNDVGDWAALWEIGEKDGDGNVVHGDAILHDAKNVYVRADRLIGVIGLEDVVVVSTDDAVLISARDKAQDVKLLVDRLKSEKRDETVQHTTVHRPWGSYRGVDAGPRFLVKRLVVKPGEKLSLQKHYHRAEHWVVVEGTALVTRGGEEVFVYENQSIYIPTGVEHRLENPGKVPLQLIEVQTGSYLAEDDIVRLEDGYGRIVETPKK